MTVVTSSTHIVLDAHTMLQRFLDPDTFRSRIGSVPTDQLAVLYSTLHDIRENAWQCQCILVGELLRRAARGDRAADAIADELGVSRREVYYKAKIADELLSDPDCASAVTQLPGQTWARIAVETSDPKAAYLEAARRKVEDPSFSTREFAAVARSAAPTTITRIILECDGTAADHIIGQQIEREYRRPVVLTPRTN